MQVRKMRSIKDSIEINQSKVIELAASDGCAKADQILKLLKDLDSFQLPVGYFPEGVCKSRVEYVLDLCKSAKSVFGELLTLLEAHQSGSMVSCQKAKSEPEYPIKENTLTDHQSDEDDEDEDEEKEERGQLADRHESIMIMEKNIIDLHQLFQDLSDLINGHAAAVSTMEEEVEDSVALGDQAVQNLKESVQKQKIVRRKKICFLVIFILSVIITVFLILFRKTVFNKN